jgi:formylglycine-generating enzyme required for sulfatase activity
MMSCRHSRNSLFVLIMVGLLALSAVDAGILPEDGDARYELVFWESIKDSDRAADYEAYLEAFPNGRFAPLARARAAYLRKVEQTSKANEPAFKVKELQDEYRVLRTASVREGPSVNSKRVGVVDKGNSVLVTGRVVDSNWYRVKTGAGQTGFMYGALLTKTTEITNKPIITVEPNVTDKAQDKRPNMQKVTKKKASPPPIGAPSLTETLSQTTSFRDCAECPEMVFIAPDSYKMGDRHGDKSEQPVHKVTLTQPFAIGKYEVTVNEWKACVNDKGCTYLPKTTGMEEDHPVRDISWTDAQQYVKWLSKKTGERYRLPTEAEWEFAARGGTLTRFWWGDQFELNKVNCKNCGGVWDRELPSKVGRYAPNPFGLYDMNGGVWEWVDDCWHKSYHGAPRDGSSWGKKNCRVRVLRGGSWRNDRSYMYSACRFRYDADVRFIANGFRVVKTQKP